MSISGNGIERLSGVTEVTSAEMGGHRLNDDVEGNKE